jgi:hypothetical protein
MPNVTANVPDVLSRGAGMQARLPRADRRRAPGDRLFQGPPSRSHATKIIGDMADDEREPHAQGEKNLTRRGMLACSAPPRCQTYQ